MRKKDFFFLQTGYVSLEVTWLGKLQDTMQGLKSIKEAKEQLPKVGQCRQSVVAAISIYISTYLHYSGGLL